MYGARFSLAVGIVAVAIALAVGVTLGAIAGYYGGTVEDVIMRVTDIFASVPNLSLIHICINCGELYVLIYAIIKETKVS